MVNKIKCVWCGKEANYIIEGSVSGTVKAVYDQRGNFVDLLDGSVNFIDNEFKVLCANCKEPVASVKFSGGAPVFGNN